MIACYLSFTPSSLKFPMLYHCCIHSRTKTYPDKAVEKQKRLGTRPGQGGDKRADNVDKQDRQTWTKDKRNTGFSTWHEDSRRTPRQTWPLEAGEGHQEDQTRTQVSPARPEDGSSKDNWRTRDKKRTRGGQDEDKTRTAGGQEKDKRRTRGGQEEDKRRTREGQEEDNNRTGGQDPDIASRPPLQTLSPHTDVD